MPTQPITLIAHDLKNALASLESELAVLVETSGTSGAKSAHQHCGELRRQFVQFLMVYGTEGGLRAHCEDESPQDLLESVRNMASSRYASQSDGIQIDLATSDETPSYWFFDLRLAQLALDAALQNASRFAREKITLSVRQDQGYLVLVVDDDGPGLGSSDDAPASTGLGTDLCRAVAQAHRSGERHGRIELYNRTQGGTRFELWLP